MTTMTIILKNGFLFFVTNYERYERQPENTHHSEKYHCTYGWSPVLRVYITFKNNIFSLLVKSSLVKLETSCTVILFPTVSVLFSASKYVAELLLDVLRSAETEIC